MGNRLLIVDDEQEWLDVLTILFSRKGWEVKSALSGELGWRALEQGEFDLVLCDLAMPDITGLQLLKRVRSSDISVPFIIMTGVGTIQTAVEAVQFGAYNYITKPFKTQDLEELACQAVEHGRMHRQLEQHDPQPMRQLPMVMGNHKSLQNILLTIDKVAQSVAPVLIQGETGTGKSLMASHIHMVSNRRSAPFVTIDCSSLPETLLESELFGHVRGAFTSAVSTRRGLLEDADGGTVFLDEIGELSLATQVKILHAIQEKEIKPVGGNKNINIDVRFIAATNRDLLKEVSEGRFREDLYYRLAVILINLPPLRERMDDLTSLVGHFVQKYNLLYNKNITEVSPATMQMLMEQPWKGNIRELENVIERAVLLSEGTVIQPSTLGLSAGTISDCQIPAAPISLQQSVQEAEKRAIANALSIAGGNRTQAAILLGIGRRTLYDKLEEYQI